MLDLDIILTMLALNMLCFYLGYKVGMHLAVIRIISRLLEDPREIQQAIREYRDSIAEEQTQAQGGREIRVEKVGGIYYLYAKDNDEFLAQGASLALALEAVAARYPNQEFQGHMTKEAADKLGVKLD